MAVNAGEIITVGGKNVIDRLQSAGLNNVSTTFDTVREVGNYLVVDKIPQEPDFTFSMESWDVSTDMMAMLTGQVGTNPLASASAPGVADPDGTFYRWEDANYVNITSPWKDPETGSAGVITAGHIVPGYFPTSISYRFGITDNASQTVELAGGEFYYAKHAPVEEIVAASGTTYTTTDTVVRYRRGGAASTEYQYVWGVLVGNVAQIPGVDFTVAGTDGATATITFVSAPASGKKVRFCYFTEAPKAFPQGVAASVVTKPGAVRGRNIQVYVGKGADQVRLGSVQSVELNATVDTEVERELGSDQIIGRSINGRDCQGSITIRSRDAASFIRLLSKFTGVNEDEVFGFQNLNTVPLFIVIENPKNPGVGIKTLYVKDAILSMPGTPAQVNSPTDFSFDWQAQDGTFAEVKGEYLG